jgi:O-antigen ligase
MYIKAILLLKKEEIHLVNNSVLSIWIITCWHRFVEIYDYSLAGRIINSVYAFICKSARNSIIGRWFQERGQDGTILRESIVIRTVGKPFKYVRKSNVFRNSLLFSITRLDINKLINTSTIYVGSFTIAFSTVYLLTRFYREAGIDLATLLLFGGIVIGLLLCIMNTGIADLYKGSVLCRFITRISAKVLDYKPTSENQIITDDSFRPDSDQDTVKDHSINIPTLITIIILGLIFGAATYFVSLLYCLAGIVGVIGIVAVIRFPNAGLYVLAASIPFLPTLAVLGLSLFTFVAFMFKNIPDRSFKFKISPIAACVALIVFLYAYSASTSLAPSADINVFLTITVFFAFVLVFINMISNMRQLMNITVIMVLSGALVSLYGIYQQLSGNVDTRWQDPTMFDDISGRVVSTLANPNVLGEYLILLIPLALALIYIKRGGINKLVFTAALAVMALCLIYTYSRGCWIGIIVGLILFLAIKGKKLWIFGIAGAMTVVSMLPSSVLSRFTSIGDLKDSSSSFRLLIWLGTLRMLKDFWLPGIGLSEEAFGRAYPFYSYIGIDAPHPHNLFLQINTQAGIVALITFLVLIIIFYRVSIIEYLKNMKTDAGWIIVAVMSAMAAFLVQSMFDNTWYNYRLILMFSMVLGIGVKTTMLLRSERHNVEETSEVAEND